MKWYSKYLFFIKPIILDGPPGIKSSGFVTVWSNHIYCTVGSKHTERLFTGPSLTESCTKLKTI